MKKYEQLELFKIFMACKIFIINFLTPVNLALIADKKRQICEIAPAFSAPESRLKNPWPRHLLIDKNHRRVSMFTWIIGELEIHQMDKFFRMLIYRLINFCAFSLLYYRSISSFKEELQKILPCKQCSNTTNNIILLHFLSNKIL